MESPIARARAAWVSLALVVALVSALFGVASARDSKLDLSGRITANDGTPIAGASIVLSSQRLTKRTHSDARGRFDFRDLPSGTYAIYAAAPGYEPLSESTITIDEANKKLTLVLSPATTNSLTVIGQVRATSGETVSTSSAPSISLPAQQAAAAGVTTVSSMLFDQLSLTPILPLGGG